MRYLFFDIECADGAHSICEFGYVLCDEKFNVQTQKNILINPECKFNLRGRPGQKDLILSYPEDEYYNHPKFEDYYENIRFLLTQKDIVIFGHSVGNDILFLLKDCGCHQLPRFDFDAYDTQNIYRELSKSNARQTALEVAYGELVDEEIRNQLIDHRASDDALKTMYILKGIVDRLGFTVSELLESCPNSVYHAINHYEKTKESSKKRHEMRSKSPFNKEKAKAGQVVWDALCDKQQSMLEQESSIGKIITLSSEVKASTEILESIIKIVEKKGFVAYKKVDGSDYFITLNEKNKKLITEGLRYPYGGKIITYQEFVDMNL